MAYLVSDKSKEITTGSIYLPKAGAVPIGAPVVGVGIVALKEELATLYGDRFEVRESKAPSQPVESAPEPKPPTRKKQVEGKGDEG
jgi:hypothetical protein